MNTFLVVAIAVAGTGLAFFSFMGLVTWTQYRSQMTRSDRADAESAEARYLRDRGTREQRIRRWLALRGFDGDPRPLAIGLVVVYLALSVVFRLLGLPVSLSVAVALPASAVTAYLALRTIAVRRRRAFNRQLIDYLRSVASLVETGNGLDSAMRMAAANAEDPLRAEMEAILNSQSTHIDELLGELADRYPSRALDLFTAAMRLNRYQSGGARMAPILRESADLMQRDRDLSSEAVAELSQTKGEFYAIVATIGFICVTLFASSDGPTREALLSPAGVAAVGLAGANFVWGIFRALRKFSLARGEVG